jgi:hypothetical protein
VKLRLLLGMLVVGMATACGGSNEGAGGGGGGAEGEGGTVKVALEEQDGSGKSGTAELFPGAASTDVTIEIVGQSDLDPIHVHTGTCDAPGEEVVHEIGFTTANLGQGQIFAPIGDVANGEHLIDIHDDKNDKVIMCGEIPEQ